MAAEYKLTANPSTVLRTADGAYIGESDVSRDWLAYQEWLAAGGIPDPWITPLPPAVFDWGPRFIEVIGR